MKDYYLSFAFNTEAVLNIPKELLTCTYSPCQFLFTYEFLQDHIEVLFKKLRQRSGWNKNLNVMQSKYTLRRIVIRNNIELSPAGNYTAFDCSFLSDQWTVRPSNKEESNMSH